MAIAASLWVGNKRSVALLQNTGLLEAGDSTRSLGIDINLPLVIMTGCRGWTRHGTYSKPLANINYYLI